MVHCLKSLTSGLIWYLLSTLPATSTTKSTEELERLRNFGPLSSRVRNNRHLTIKLNIRVYSLCVLSVLQCSSKTGQHIPATKTVTTFFTSRASAPSLVPRVGTKFPPPPSYISPSHMHRRSQGGKGSCPPNSCISCRFVLREAVSQTKYCFSLEAKYMVPQKFWAGDGTAHMTSSPSWGSGICAGWATWYPLRRIVYSAT